LESQDRFRGCLLGLATGDAVGTALEFEPRGSFTPITDMVGGGPFELAAGQWTDDTSMALCLATSLVERGGFDALDQMQRYCNWYEHGYLSSNGCCFDIGNTVASALLQFRQTGDPMAGSEEPLTAGNGCIMRLAPVPMFYFPDQRKAIQFAAESSRTTHGTLECLEACRLLARILIQALAGQPKETVLFDSYERYSSSMIGSIASGDYRQKTSDAIRSSGYVVHTLEAALWCFLSTDNFESAILAAANLGGDADTTAAVCGQVAGAYYGVSGIPEHWLQRLAMRQEIVDLADRLRGQSHD